MEEKDKLIVSHRKHLRQALNKCKALELEITLSSYELKSKKYINN